MLRLWTLGAHRSKGIAFQMPVPKIAHSQNYAFMHVQVHDDVYECPGPGDEPGSHPEDARERVKFHQGAVQIPAGGSNVPGMLILPAFSLDWRGKSQDVFVQRLAMHWVQDCSCGCTTAPCNAGMSSKNFRQCSPVNFLRRESSRWASSQAISAR